jgi:hypothetical protein
VLRFRSSWRVRIIFQERPQLADTVEKVGSSLPSGRPRDSLNHTDSAGETAMMGIQETPARLFYDFCLDEHVPSDHMLRGIDRHLDLAEFRRCLKPFYSQMGSALDRP